MVVFRNAAEGAMDVAEMGPIEYGREDCLCAYRTVGRLRVHFVHDGHGLFLLSFGRWLDVQVGRRRLSRRALGNFSAMPSVSARERISIQTSAGSIPARCHSATRW